jgi:signal transduction histidine kinase
MASDRSRAHGQSPLPRAVASSTDEIVERLEQRLLLDNPLLADPDVRAQMMSQVRSILAAAAARLASPAAYRGQSDAADLSAEIAGTRTNAGIHPRESLRAAVLLFEAALPVVLRELGPASQTAEGVETAALALHSEIMDRVSAAAVPYISLLLQRMHTSQFDERRRIARDLHDRAAHAVGAAMQQLELHDAYATLDPVAAKQRLCTAREALEEGLRVIRGLAAELGSSPTEDGLEKALARYLDANVPPSIRVRLSCHDDITLIPSEISDELYFVIREAVRNALIHAQTTELHVTLTLTGNVVLAVVEDFGCGLDITAQIKASSQKGSGTGLTSMRERIELLGGVFALSSMPGKGTKAEILVPLSTARQ